MNYILCNVAKAIPYILRVVSAGSGNQRAFSNFVALGARLLPSPFPYFISRLRITFSLVLSSVNRLPLPFLLSFRLSNLDQIAKCGSNFGVAAVAVVAVGRSECAPRTAPRLPCRACGLCAERERGRGRGRWRRPRRMCSETTVSLFSSFHRVE